MLIRRLDDDCISIHTPARGVTYMLFKNYLLLAISIHTPARGVTLIIIGGKPVYSDFNPHSRKGSDS